jgi:nucleoside 2-deoxyribosyltransferase
MIIRPGQRIFCSYAFTGEDTNLVGKRMRTIVDVLEKADLDVYCNLEDPESISLKEPHEFIEVAIRQLKTCDCLFALVTSERRSEGMLVEIGAALALGKPIILGQHESAVGTSYVPALASYSFVWKDDEELLATLSKIVSTINTLPAAGEPVR